MHKIKLQCIILNCSCMFVACVSDDMNLNCIGLVLFLWRRALLNIHHDISHPALQCEICSYLFGSVSRTASLVTSENLLTFPFCNGHRMIEVSDLCCWEMNVFPHFANSPVFPQRPKFLFSRSLVCKSPDLLRQPDVCDSGRSSFTQNSPLLSLAVAEPIGPQQLISPA